MRPRLRFTAAQAALIFSLSVMLLLVPSSRAAETIPAQLSDEAFWKILDESSEPDGKFLSENFLSNEQGFQYVIPPVLERIKPGGVYLGVGPEQNFTYIAAFHPDIAFVIDIRRQNLIQHLLYKAIFETSTNRAEFLSMLFCRKATESLSADSSVESLFKAFGSTMRDADLYSANLLAVKDRLEKRHHFQLTKDDETTLEHVYDTISRQGIDLGYSVSISVITNYPSIQVFSINPVDPNVRNAIDETRLAEIITARYGTPVPFPNYSHLMSVTDAMGRNWSYLVDETNYQSVRQMEQKNLIVPIVGDFAGPHALRSIAQYMHDHVTTVSVFYLSNVEQYLTPPETLRRFYDNVATLPLNPGSTFIRSTEGTGVQPGVAQSSFSPIQEVLDAVLDGLVQKQADILRLFR